MADRCHWTRESDGSTTLIPRCWSRVQDPDAECHCGQWSEDTAAEKIRSLRDENYRLRHTMQAMRKVIRAAGLVDPTEEPILGVREYSRLQRRKAIHRAITAAGNSDP